ncbi:hypothetical protein [Niabella hibiscisoli]|uniref:hypothetical protein n=1 Tax=Niabella hibiscisoli TaxID=1825928 RepID=UPI001F1167C5|nr:hypothetical protein [Niabella hibiscisoli]MCH5719242.1 hypothetical protein [Niabella hibiscisoli]
MIDVYDPRDILIDQYAFTAVPAINRFTGSTPGKEFLLSYHSKEATLSASGRNTTMVLNKTTGTISITDAKNNTVIDALPRLMVLPLNGQGRGVQMTGTSQVFEPFTATAANRVLQDIAYQTAAGTFTVTVRDEYDEAKGFTTLTFTGDGNVQVTYRYTLKQPINPRQWGLVFSLPDGFNKLSWKRDGLWNYYPQDQIGRLTGSAPAFSNAPVSGAAGPADQPSGDWSQDRNELGTNDFRSTKMNILEAVLEASTAKVKVVSEGTQHIRSWKEKNRTKMLVADYSNLGSEGFFRSHASLLDQPLKKDDIMEGSVHLQIIL